MKIFEFSSGGAYHPEGHGAWIVNLEDNSLALSHNVKGKITNLGTFQINQDEADKLWNLIDNANFKQSARPGIPDEPMFIFAIQKQKIEIWSGDARDDDKISSVIDFISKLIEKYSKKKPILW